MDKDQLTSAALEATESDLSIPDFVPGSSVGETPLGHVNADEDINSENDTVVEDRNITDLAQELVPKKEKEDAGAKYQRRHLDEDPQHPNWPLHKKHIFVLSCAGKPIYSRYGDEGKLAGLCGVLSGIISFVKDQDKDEIKAIMAGNHKFVFLLKGNIYLVAVSQTTESIAQLKRDLEYMHSQICSVLTSGVNKILDSKPQFDLRNLLSRTDYKFLDNLASAMDRYPSYILNTIHCLRLGRSVRTTIGNILQNSREQDLFYAILIANQQMVHLVRPRKHILFPPDLHLIINFVNSSDSFRSSDESWTPFCLPHFNSRGFLHLYVCYLTTDLCLLLVFSKADNVYIKGHKSKDQILNDLKSSQCIEAINFSLKQQHYSVDEVKVPGLLHFVYKSLSTSQLTAPSFGPPYKTRKEQKRLFRMYQHIHQRVHALSKPHKVYFHIGDSETMVAWITSGFELYAAFGPLESKPVCIKACNQLLRWIKLEENSLFILNSPVW